MDLTAALACLFLASGDMVGQIAEPTDAPPGEPTLYWVLVGLCATNGMAAVYVASMQRAKHLFTVRHADTWEAGTLDVGLLDGRVVRRCGHRAAGGTAKLVRGARRGRVRLVVLVFVRPTLAIEVWPWELTPLAMERRAGILAVE